jgi:hypothetical protein
MIDHYKKEVKALKELKGIQSKNQIKEEEI